MCFGCLKEPSRRDGSFEHPQHMVLLRNKKNNFQMNTFMYEADSSAIQDSEYLFFLPYLLLHYMKKDTS